MKTVNKTTKPEPAQEIDHTQWLAIALLFFAGCSTALHMGKVPSAIPLLRDQWHLSLTQAGLIVSIYSLLIAVCGLLLGVLVRRVGFTVFAVLGIATVGAGSLIGAQADSLNFLLFGRAVEGLGWILAVIALPSLLSALSLPTDRPLVMGIWGAFVPLGAGLMLLLGPWLQEQGSWRYSWWFASGVSFAAAFIAARVLLQQKKYLTALRGRKSVAQFADLAKPIVWLLSGCFFIYSFQFLAVMSFIPTLFMETTNLSLSSASRLAALVIMSNAIGNVLAGVLIRRGAGYVPLLVVGALGTGVFAFILFSAWLPYGLRISSAFAFSVLGGLIPGVLFATVPKAASQVSAVGLLIGLMMQLAGVGQLLGGFVIPASVDYFDTWLAGGVLALIASFLGVSMALLSTRYGRLK